MCGSGVRVGRVLFGSGGWFAQPIDEHSGGGECASEGPFEGAGDCECAYPAVLEVARWYGDVDRSSFDIDARAWYCQFGVQIRQVDRRGRRVASGVAGFARHFGTGCGLRPLVTCVSALRRHRCGPVRAIGRRGFDRRIPDSVRSNVTLVHDRAGMRWSASFRPFPSVRRAHVLSFHTAALHRGGAEIVCWWVGKSTRQVGAPLHAEANVRVALIWRPHVHDGSCHQVSDRTRRHRLRTSLRLRCAPHCGYLACPG